MSSTDTVQCPVCKENIPTDYVVCPYDGYSLVKQLREKIHTKIKFREGVGRAIRLIRSPIRNTPIVMDEVTNNTDRKGPLFVLFILSWVFGAQIGPYFNSYYASTIPLDIGWIFFLMLIGGFIIGLVTYLFFIIFWYIISFMIHYSSKMFASTSLSGSAAFKETQSVVGYALVPYIVGMFFLNIILFFILPTGITGESFFTTKTYSSIGVKIVSGLGPNVASAVGTFYLIFFVGSSIWSVFICANGIEKLHRIPKNQSFAIPIVIIALVVFLTYF